MYLTVCAIVKRNLGAFKLSLDTNWEVERGRVLVVKCDGQNGFQRGFYKSPGIILLLDSESMGMGNAYGGI